MRKKAIVLARVSTVQQELESQTAKVLAAAKADGFVDPIVIEHKESAVKKSESEMLGINEMKRCIEAGGVEAVYCYELSRLSRRPKDLYVIRDYLIEHGIQLVVLNPSFKLLDAEGKLDQMANIVFGLFGAFAEQECMLRSERCQRGKQKKREEGKFIGGKCPMGYDRDSDNNFIINKDAEVVKRIFNMFVGGYNRLEIARILMAEGYFLNFLSPTAAHTHINNVLHNADYTGLHGRPQIISQNLFDRAQEKLNHPQTPRRKTKRIALARGIMFNPKTYSHRKKFYVDTRQGNYYCLTDSDEQRKKFIKIEAFDAVLWDAVKQVYAQQRDGRARNKEKKIQKQRAVNLTRRIAHLEAEVNGSQGQLEKCEERLIMRKISESKAAELEAKIIAARDQALKELEDLRHQLEELNNDGFRIEDPDKLSGEEKEALVARLVHHIDLVPTGRLYTCRWSYTIFWKRGDALYGSINKRM